MRTNLMQQHYYLTGHMQMTQTVDQLFCHDCKWIVGTLSPKNLRTDCGVITSHLVLGRQRCLLDSDHRGPHFMDAEEIDCACSFRCPGHDSPASEILREEVPLNPKTQETLSDSPTAGRTDEETVVRESVPEEMMDLRESPEGIHITYTAHPKLLVRIRNAFKKKTI